MKKLMLVMVAAILLPAAARGEWQWRVSVPGWVSEETKAAPDAFLWIPEQCDTVRALIFANQNMNEETLFEMESFRNHLRDMNIALVWFAPMLEQQWDVRTGVQTAFDATLAALADVSGYDELTTVPVIPFGHSAQATMPWNFAAWNPDRTLCVVSYHGDAPRTNLCGYGRENLEWGRTRNIDGIPGLMIEGEYEWWDARVIPALSFQMKYPKSCVSFLGDAGRGHFDVAERTADYIALFIRKSLEQRPNLEPLDPADGWRAQWWQPTDGKRPKAAPAAKYKGDPHESFWYFDEEMATLAEQRYAETRGKQPAYLNYSQNGELLQYDENLHVRTRARFLPDADGLTYHLGVHFVDSTRNSLTDAHPAVRPSVKRICGPVKVLDDSTFRVDFYRTGMNNPKRTWDMVLCAEAPGDKTYKESVQQIEIKLPYRHTDGLRQTIFFRSLDDVRLPAEQASPSSDSAQGQASQASYESYNCHNAASLPAIRLEATTDRGLPVSFYVKEGPAEVDGDTLRITPIPPRAKFPVKVTVVGWQYGLAGRVNTADPVEQTFYITR